MVRRGYSPGANQRRPLTCFRAGVDQRSALLTAVSHAFQPSIAAVIAASVTSVSTPSSPDGGSCPAPAATAGR